MFLNKAADESNLDMSNGRDFSDYQNNFINGRFSFRYSRCKFITINK